MKTKLFTLLLAVAASVGTMYASNTQVDGIWYDFDSSTKTASVTFGGNYYVSYSNEYSGSVVIPSSVTYQSVTYSVTSIGNYAFRECSGLTSVTIGNSVTSIGSSAFSGCSSLTSVTIPNSVTSIGDYAFNGCTGLTGELIIPNSVTSIGGSAFYGCSSSLTSIIVESGNTVYDSRNNCNAIIETATNTLIAGCQSTIIPNSVTSIGNFAFWDCSGLTSVTILSDNFETNDGAIFIHCPNLTYMSGPANMLYISDVYLSMYTISRRLKNVTITCGEMTENEFLALHEAYKSLESADMSAATNTTLSDEAFNEFYNLQTLILPANLTHIGYKSVAECVKLQSIDIPASVEEIDDRAFEDCRSLKSITFGGSPAGAPGRFNASATSASQLRRIGNWAFYNAHELQNLEIPEGVEEIGDGAFYGCTYLEDLVLPSSVQTIGDNTFALCAKLQKIVVNSVTPPTIEAKTFFDVKRQIPVYVPDEAVASYDGDIYWREFDIQGASQMPTGIDNVSSSLQGGDGGRLILRNGQIFILRGDKTFTVTGQEVK